ncbi:hypothetical protein SteCoe_9922 [Stentor coeruleus]|uniref:Uncharacterized protein n=1 Tax=Stentor coeruleus TaxID=5963 RepID=A0A1R2CGN5_9CILI|nr:hypothetical protein SteCoe_9922 [Stentor coeruleus]
MNSKCQKYKSYHKKQCTKICENINCIKNSQYHKGKCTIICKDSNCKNFLKPYKTKIFRYYKEGCIKDFKKKGRKIKKCEYREFYTENIENNMFKENYMNKEELSLCKNCKTQHINDCKWNTKYLDTFDCINIENKKGADEIEENIDYKSKDCKRDFKNNERESEDIRIRSFAKSIAKDDSDDERCYLNEEIEENNEISRFDNILCAVVITFAVYMLFPKAEKTAIINFTKMLL